MLIFSDLRLLNVISFIFFVFLFRDVYKRQPYDTATA